MRNSFKIRREGLRIYFDFEGIPALLSLGVIVAGAFAVGAFFF